MCAVRKGPFSVSAAFFPPSVRSLAIDAWSDLALTGLWPTQTLVKLTPHVRNAFAYPFCFARFWLWKTCGNATSQVLAPTPFMVGLCAVRTISFCSKQGLRTGPSHFCACARPWHARLVLCAMNGKAGALKMDLVLWSLTQCVVGSV